MTVEIVDFIEGTDGIKLTIKTTETEIELYFSHSEYTEFRNTLMKFEGETL